MNRIVFACKNLVSELKQTDIQLSLFTQWVLLYFMLTISMMSSSIQHYLQGNLDNLLGSDAVISRYQPVEPEQREQLATMVDNVVETRLMNITLTNGAKYQSTQLKLIDHQYPLQGTVSIGDTPAGEHVEVKHGPAVGMIWMESRLLSKLALSVGDKISLNQKSFTVGKVLFHEPDRLMEGHSVAMRAMINLDDLPDSLSSDSIHYRYLLSVTKKETVEQWVKTELPDAEFISRSGSHHPLSGFWKRVENFLGLAGIILFFMAAVAIDSVGSRQASLEKYRQAIYLSMGQSLSFGISTVFIKWVVSFLGLTLIAFCLSFISQSIIIDYIGGTFSGIKSDIRLQDVVVTLAIAFAILTSLNIPHFAQLKHASVLSLIRQQESNLGRTARIIWSVFSLSLLAVWYSDNPLLTGMMLTSLAVTIILIALTTVAVLKTGEKIFRNRAGKLAFTLYMMNQRLLHKSTQIIGVGLCLMLLLFTLMLMKDIGAMLERNTRTQDGNLLVSKATPQQIETLTKWSAKTQSKIKQMRPYTRASLVEVNGLRLEDYASHPSESLSVVQKPIRLSWSQTVPKNNRVTAGKWWSSSSDDWHQISVEDEVLSDLALSIGDELTFLINQQKVNFIIVSSHAFTPGNGSITFWFQIPENARAMFTADDYFMGSMELPDSAWSQLTQVWQAHPSIGMVPLKEITQTYDETLAMVRKLVFGYSSLLILLSILVIAASIKRFEDSDKQKNGLLLSFGMEKKNCSHLQVIEWSITGLIASVGAIAGTWIAGQLIYQSQFGITYVPDFLSYTLVLTVVVSLITIVGYQLTRKALRVSIKDLLMDS